MPPDVAPVAAAPEAPITPPVATTTGVALADAVAQAVAGKDPVSPAAAPATPPEKPAEPAGATQEAKETPAEKAAKEREAARFAALAKRERAIVESQRKAKAETEADRAKLTAEREQHAKELEDFRAFRAAQENAKRDPGGYLRRLLGDTWYEQLTEYKLGGEKPSATAEVEAVRAEVKSEIEALRKTQAEEKAAAEKAAQERQAAEAQATIERFHQDTVAYVTAKADEYELTNALGQHALVYEVIEQAFERSGKLLSVQEAAKHVEKHLEEQVVKASASAKVRARIAPPATAPAPAQEQEQPPRAAVTITNAVAGAPAAAPHRLSEAERIARAQAALDEVFAQRARQ